MSLDFRQYALTVPQAACILPSVLRAAGSRGRIVAQRHNRFEQSIGILGCDHCSGTRYLAALLERGHNRPPRRQQRHGLGRKDYIRDDPLLSDQSNISCRE
jgi:hypothetical protein